MSAWVRFVRLAEPREAAELAELHRRAALEGYAHIFPPEAPAPTLDELLSRWRFWLGPDREEGRRTFVADLGGGPVAVVLVGPDPGAPTVGHLARLYVEPSEWGRAIGRALYDVAMSHLEHAGLERATLWVLEANNRARTWYERLGWRFTGERKTVYAPAFIDDLQYELTLD